MKLVKTILLASAVAVAGCGSSESSCPDGGCVATPDGGSSSDTQMLWGLTRGMDTPYTVTAVSAVTDGCMEDPSGLMGMAIPVTYDETSMMVSIGKAKGTPAMPAFGSGKVGANVAMLTRDNQAGDATMCYWHQTDNSLFTLFDNDKFTLQVTETLDMFKEPVCTTMMMSATGGMCTTTFTLTMQKM